MPRKRGRYIAKNWPEPHNFGGKQPVFTNITLFTSRLSSTHSGVLLPFYTTGIVPHWSFFVPPTKGSPRSLLFRQLSVEPHDFLFFSPSIGMLRTRSYSSSWQVPRGRERICLASQHPPHLCQDLGEELYQHRDHFFCDHSYHSTDTSIRYRWERSIVSDRGGGGLLP